MNREHPPKLLDNLRNEIATRILILLELIMPEQAELESRDEGEN